LVTNIVSGQPREGASPLLAGWPRHLFDRRFWTGLAAGASQGKPREGEAFRSTSEPILVGRKDPWVAGTGVGPAGSAGDNSSPRPLEAALQGGGPKGPSTGCSISAMPDFRACARVNIKKNSVLSPLVEFINAQTIETIETIENYPFPKLLLRPGNTYK